MDENNNDSDEKPDANPAPPLSSEFLSGGTAAGLEKIRARLLDITNRNRLLNFRHTSASSIFDERRNVPEAAAIVDAVLDHMQNRPDESLGVVALNFEQRELIEELLDRRLRTEPFAISYQERMDSGPEPLFIKNLKNVQGDERDVIFVSATYGPDAKGNQYQRFGPINGPNGHRRLNVLFTRAKKRTEVFSSLDADKIQTTSSSAWGLRVLKQYLTFARTGVLESADDGGPQPANDFERSVGAVLKEKGFDVIPQVGVAGFFVDLAVRHPTKPGTYLLGLSATEPATIPGGPRATGTGFGRRSSKTRDGKFTVCGPQTGSRAETRRSSGCSKRSTTC